ncbi:hypothetical protein BDN72DRAFT_958173 [Pluteus cervinus]|uniref:Uncharacterized protein n=1 Tax=Pluteus cervinus TaxID=181527 RepID=A0ACD3AZ35_9AGAR|nr:hypothetical protein BDN72DRAFT_958173 [Pluteus cervinus]
MADVRAPFLEASEASRYYPEGVRKQPLPSLPVPSWKARRSVFGMILALAIIGAVVGIVVSIEAKKSNKSDAKSDSASGAGASSNGTVAARSNAGVAAVNWNVSTGQQVRLYIQKVDGFVYEAVSDESSNWSLDTTKLFQATPGTPLTAVALAPSQIHLYYLDISNMLQEYIYNNSQWATGVTPLPSTNIAPNTSLASTTWTDPSAVQQIRLYYQKRDNTIQELVYTTGSAWSSGHSFTDQAYPGTGLGAFATHANDILDTRVYWQANDLTLNEYFHVTQPDSWSRSTLQWSAAPSSGIAAAAWPDPSGNPNIRLYYENIAGNVEEISYGDTSGSGGNPSPPTNTIVGFQAPISATLWVNETDVEIRTYAKSNSSNTRTEFAYSGGWTSKDLGF